MNPDACAAGFDRWLADLEMRHLRDLTTAEVARALRALSSTYVERRARLGGRGAFDSAGKRAAYALYYAPRRYAMVRAILTGLAAPTGPRAIVDLGCGTGAAGAAWACHAGPGSTVQGLDSHPWAVDEARATYRAFALAGEARRGSVTVAGPARDGRRRRSPADGIVLSYVANELDDAARAPLLDHLLATAAAGTAVLVLEPLSRKTSPWWPAWTRAVEAAGGRQDEWRVRLAPPPLVVALGRAAGLDPLEGTGRTLWLARG
ncbi:MAG: small ribosomal subunit Rsm22 family protein [Vicinamibacterales bacterium]